MALVDMAPQRYDSSGTMDAVTFDGPRNMHVKQKPKPKIEEDGDVVVKVTMASICGSDLHPYAGRGARLDDGTTFGHEYAGVVVATGPEVKSIKVGDRVASAFTTNCGHCWFCTHALTCRCPKGARFGWIVKGQGIEGTQAEFVRVPMADTTLVPVPDNVTDEEALLLGDILCTGWFCAARADIPELAKAYPGEDVVAVVIGCGPVGLMAILAAQAQGANKIIAVDTVPERLQLAAGWGAIAVNGKDQDAVQKAVHDASNSRGADAVMEAVGSQGAIGAAFKYVRIGGVISSVGLHTDDQFTAFSPAEGYAKNITYRNGRCPARHYMDHLLKLIQEKRWGDPFPGTQIISHRVSLHDEKAVRDAYEKFETKRDNCTKVLLIP
jgi:threonine dehydrogenase-like Zn-dependent dehydrogenase